MPPTKRQLTIAVTRQMRSARADIRQQAYRTAEEGLRRGAYGPYASEVRAVMQSSRRGQHAGRGPSGIHHPIAEFKAEAKAKGLAKTADEWGIDRITAVKMTMPFREIKRQQIAEGRVKQAREPTLKDVAISPFVSERVAPLLFPRAGPRFYPREKGFGTYDIYEVRKRERVKRRITPAGEKIIISAIQRSEQVQKERRALTEEREAIEADIKTGKPEAEVKQRIAIYREREQKLKEAEGLGKQDAAVIAAESAGALERRYQKKVEKLERKRFGEVLTPKERIIETAPTKLKEGPPKEMISRDLSLLPTIQPGRPEPIPEKGVMAEWEAQRTSRELAETIEKGWQPISERAGKVLIGVHGIGEEAVGTTLKAVYVFRPRKDLISTAFAGRITTEEVFDTKALEEQSRYRQFKAIGGTAAEVGSLFLGYGVGTAMTAAALLSAPTTQEAALHVGFGLALVGGAKLIGSTAKLGETLTRYASPTTAGVYGKGAKIIGEYGPPAVFLGLGGLAAAPIGEAIYTEQYVKAEFESRRLASAFAGAQIGGYAGGWLGQRFSRNIENINLLLEQRYRYKEAAEYPLLKEAQKTIWFNLKGKEFKTAEIPYAELEALKGYPQAQRVAHKSLLRVKEDIFISGTAAQYAQLPKIKPPKLLGDIDIGITGKKSMAQVAKELQKEWKKAGLKLDVFVKPEKIETGYKGKHLFSLHPAKSFISTIEIMSDMAELYPFYVTKTPSKIPILKLRTQAKGKLRRFKEKDVPHLKVLTEAKLKPKVGVFEEQLGTFYGKIKAPKLKKWLKTKLYYKPYPYKVPASPPYPSPSYPPYKAPPYKPPPYKPTPYPPYKPPPYKPTPYPPYKPPPYRPTPYPPYKPPPYKPTPYPPYKPPPYLPYKPPPHRPPPPPPLVFLEAKAMPKKAAIRREPGYHVFVKRKQAKLGKKRYKGKGFAKVNTKPLTKKAAKGLGADVTDTYTNRSFFIKPAGKPAKPSFFGHLWDSLGSKFRGRKSRGKGVGRYVEKSAHAIDSFEEKQGIPYEAARQRRAKLFGRAPRKKASKEDRRIMKMLGY